MTTDDKIALIMLGVMIIGALLMIPYQLKARKKEKFEKRDN